MNRQLKQTAPLSPAGSPVPVVPIDTERMEF